MERVDSILERVLASLTAEDVGPLAQFPCPFCHQKSGYETFEHQSANHIGLRCRACGEVHPFGVRWLRHAGSRRKPTPIGKLMRDRGAYCWLCGQDADLLASFHIHMHSHHTRGEKHPKAAEAEEIPLCAHCHEIATAIQKAHDKLLSAEARLA